MKKALFIFLALLLGGAPQIMAADVGIDLNLHIGNRSPEPIIVDDPPLFLVPAALGFHVAVGVPYDMFHIEGLYYLQKEEVWYVAPGYDGPWKVTRRDRLPRGLARGRYADIIALRNEEYVHYQRNPGHYKGKSYRPEKIHKAGQGKGNHKKGHG